MTRILLIILIIPQLLIAKDEYDELIQKYIDFEINDKYEEINLGLNSDLYLIEVRYEIVDTFYIDNIITRSNKSSYITSDMSLKADELARTIDPVDWDMKLKGIYNTPVFILFKVQCNPFLDKSLINDSELRHHKNNLKIKMEDESWCQDDIEIDKSLQFINIKSKEKSSNIKLKEKQNTISLQRDDIYDNSWAVIIGIDKYKYSKPLSYAVKDAEAVKDMLISKFNYSEDNIRYLINEQATLSEIKLALGEVATSAGDNDRIIVFYSGHGETLRGVNDSEKGYIIPFEGKQDNPYATGLSMDEILTTSQLSKSKHMLFLMDACYSGLMIQRFKGLDNFKDKGYLNKVANESSRQIITAGGKDEQVIERSEWQHSAFTKNLLEGLNSWEADFNEDGYITANELSLYLRENVTEDSDFLQTPQEGRFLNSGSGEFVFFGSKSNIEKKLIVVDEKKSVFSSFDFAFGVFGDRGGSNRIYFPQIKGSYYNIIDNFDISIGYGRLSDVVNSSIKEIAFECRYNRPKDIAFYNFDIHIQQSKYNNDITTIGILPLVGFGIAIGPFTIENRVGYLINDIDNIYSQDNRFVFRAGTTIYLKGLIDYAVKYVHEDDK